MADFRFKVNQSYNPHLSLPHVDASEHHACSVVLPDTHALGIVIMYEDLKAKALEQWRSLLATPEIRMTAQEQYEELLSLAEKYLKQGLINRDERKVLVTEATLRYAKAVEGIGQGT
ncbi:hypothetical protein [Pseudomonas sp. NPDC086251]|uniref:hypothetical protein n=1 Tax=Pseudomonas sp. NPDC086251 TaxID=3364431 RepID=UPI0038360116